MSSTGKVVRIRPDLVPRLRARADRERRTFNAMANLLIEDRLDEIDAIEAARSQQRQDSR